MDIRNILVPVDFAPSSKFAVDYGVSLARAFRARLTLLHVVEFPALGYIFPVEGEFAAKFEYDHAIRLMSAMLGPEDQDDLDLQIRIRRGNVADEIRSAICDEDAGMIVMGTHSHGFVRRLLIGSVTQNLLRKLDIPALTVSQDAVPTMFSHILFATDLCGAYHEGFQVVLSLAQKTSAEIVLLHAIEPLPLAFGGAAPLIDSEAEQKVRLEEARQKLAELEAIGHFQDVCVRTELRLGPADDSILEVAAAVRADLIVLNVRNRGPVERAILGTTAERVVRDACVPVLSVPMNTDPNDTKVLRHSDAPNRSLATGA